MAESVVASNLSFCLALPVAKTKHCTGFSDFRPAAFSTLDLKSFEKCFRDGSVDIHCEIYFETYYVAQAYCVTLNH